jgi:uncharacterized protein
VTRFSGGLPKPVKQLLQASAGAIALLLAPFAAPAQPAAPPAIPAQSIIHATPAMWEIRDADTTIYLFGTFHTLDGRTAWLDERVRGAFDKSGELILETVVPVDMTAARAAAANQMSETSADGKRKLKPFVASTQAVMNEGRSMGMSVENGADAVLRRLAEGVGKPVNGLERFEDQLKTLSNIPVPAPAAAAAAPTAPSPVVSVTVNDLLGAWTKGDTGAFSSMLQGFETKSPVAYRMLIADRNARWGQWIASRLDQPGVVFVAVGTGHLAGKDSVQSWLAARGITATRVG